MRLIRDFHQDPFQGLKKEGSPRYPPELRLESPQALEERLIVGSHHPSAKKIKILPVAETEDPDIGRADTLSSILNAASPGAVLDDAQMVTPCDPENRLHIR